MQTKDKPQSILIVDDSAFTRKRVRQVLQDEGYALVEAINGAAALVAIGQQEFACVLTDLVMPELDGFGLLAELQFRHLATPIVVLSADIQKTTRERCEALGAAAFLQKPVNADDLRLALTSILGRQC
jgi:CheY-like chemotaxis protein